MILGIDLGTTYSVGAYIDENGNPMVITNSESETLTPSVVYFENQQSVIVGRTAKENSVLDPKNVISLVKNYMGKTQNDGTPYLFETDFGAYSPEAISSMILKKISSDATKFLGLSEPITNVVVTKPAYFQQAQIKATEDAIKLAGLNCVTLINEPTAAGLYYASKTNLSKANILVYDLGGGTFDATVIHLEDGKVKVLSTEGLRMVGGSFFDARLAQKVSDSIQAKYGIDIYDDPAYAPVKQKLLIDIENAKIQLSSVNSTSIVVFAPPVSERIELTRKDVDEVVEKLYNKTENLVYSVIKAAELELSDIDKVIMTGGSSKIPYIEEHLTKIFGMPVSREVNPNEVVALGAALYGKTLESETGKNEVLTDVCSHGIGLKTMGKNGKIFNDVLIPRNSSLPAECEKSYEVGDQKVLTLAVREGDFKDVEFTTEIATVHVELPKGVLTGAEVRIKFLLDKRQLLHIFMGIPSIRLEQEISFERKNNMTDVEFGKWQKMVMEANNRIDEKNGLRRKKEEKKAERKSERTPEPKKPEEKIPKIIESVMEDTVGMTSVKTEMRDYMNRMEAIRKLNAQGQNEDEIEKCIAILGKSGMGITHAARKVAEILYKIGEVSEKTPVFANFFDIVKEDESKTTQAIQDLFQKAVNGVLVIDDFERFYNDNDSFIGMQAVELLQSAYESADRKVTLVIAGNTELVKKIFLKKHKFERLFYNFTLELTGYSLDEYITLIHKRSKGKVIDDKADPELKRYLKGAVLTPEFDYIYFLDKMINDAITNLSNKLKNVRHAKDVDYMILHLEDFAIAKGEKTIDELMEELSQLTGIESVKQEVEKLRKEIEFDKKQEEKGELRGEAPARHMVFTGNPGTGKTTVAQIFAGIFRELGVLPIGHLVEAKPADLISEHVGGTAPKTKAVIEQALGGVLFIDEAYDIWQSENDIFGKDAVNELLTGMENNRNNLIVIIAGYSDKIAQFMKCNPGLPSRFSKYIHFEDYSIEQLTEVFTGLVNKAGMLIEEDALEAVRDTIQDSMREKTFGNARGVRKLYETILSNQKSRLIDEGDQGIDATRLIKAEDVGRAKKHKKDITFLMDEINSMVGLRSVKQKLGEFVAAAEINMDRKEHGLAQISSGTMHMIFSGNPGTGKTTVALKMGEILRALNMLSNGEVVEVQTENLTGKYEGDAEKNTMDLVESNLGKVIFIDEAYKLKDSEYGKRALNALVSLLENHRDNLCVILAGYTEPMKELLKVNEGLDSRFKNNMVEFEDYSNEELMEIFEKMMSSEENKSFLYGKDVSEAAKRYIEREAKNVERFANARGVRNLVEKMLLKQSHRILSIPKEQRTRETLTTILVQDVPGEEVKEIRPGESFEELMEELNRMIGLNSVKSEIATISDSVGLAEEYKRRGMDMGEEKPCMNMVFLGNPGTGKTTVARMVGRIYKALGVLPSGHTEEASRDKLVGRYTGHTAPLVNAVAQKAMGGVLFIDEAYSLYQGEDDQFGKEAITELLKIAEDHRDEIVIILAGYEHQMQEFYGVNPGLKSRFPNEIHFEDYTLDEKVQIFEASVKGNFYLGQGVLEAVRDLLDRATKADPEKYANGRGVRVIKEAIIKNMNRRVRPIMSSLSNEELKTIMVEDVYL